VGNVLADAAISPSGCPLKFTVAVTDTDGDAIQFWLGGILDFFQGTESFPSLNTLSRDSIGTGWRIDANPAMAAPPTRWVGDSGVTRSGYSRSRASSS
jgi:hypothetical protein